MPYKPKKPCNQPACHELTNETYCQQHKRDYDRKRGTAAERGYDWRWNKYSRWYRMNNPICVMCRNGPSQHTDHIKAVAGPDDPLFWNPSNHQALCHSCHSRKTVKEDRGFGNK